MNSGPGPKANRRSKPLSVAIMVAKLAVAAVVLFFSFLLIYTGVLHWRAERLLNAMRRVRVGKTNSEETIAIARELHGTPYVDSAEHPYLTSRRTAAVPLEYCSTNNCAIQFPRAVNLALGLDMFFQAHPKFLAWATTHILDSKPFSRRLPRGYVGGFIQLQDGYVQTLSFGMAFLAEPGNPCPEIATKITDGPVQEPSFGIERQDYRLDLSNCYSMHRVIVEATPHASQQQLNSAFSYNLRCLWPGVGCTDCDILQVVCESK